MPKLRGDLPRNGPGKSAETRASSCANIQRSSGHSKRRSHAGELGHCRGLLCRTLMSRLVCARPAAWGTCARTRGRAKRSERERIRCGVLRAAGRSSQVLDITFFFFYCMRSYQHQHAQAGAVSPFTMSSLYKPIIEVVWRRCWGIQYVVIIIA